VNKILVHICLSFILASQNAQVISPEPDEGGDDYSVTQPGFVYRGQYSQFKKINFENFVLHTFDDKNRHDICGKLHDGLWKDEDKNHLSMESLTWNDEYPLSSGNSSIQYVLVLFDYFGVGGSSESDGYAQVWSLQDKKLRIVQQIQFNTHFSSEDWYFAFDKNRQLLTVRASHYMPGDAHCCISAFDELTFRWQGGLFKLQKKVTKPTHPASPR
jgi:hypothetical protein